MASTVVTPIADKLKATMEGLTLAPALKVYRWAPKALSGPGPFAVIELPDIKRGNLLDAETELGRRDWALEFPVVFYFDLVTADVAQGRAAEVAEAFIRAVDEAPDLGIPALVEEARVTEAEVSYDIGQEGARPMLVITTTVAVAAFVP
jgi:hypothetical protein